MRLLKVSCTSSVAGHLQDHGAEATACLFATQYENQPENRSRNGVATGGEAKPASFATASFNCREKLQQTVAKSETPEPFCFKANSPHRLLVPL